MTMAKLRGRAGVQDEDRHQAANMELLRMHVLFYIS